MIRLHWRILATVWAIAIHLHLSTAGSRVGPYAIDQSCDTREGIEALSYGEQLEHDIILLRNDINDVIRVDLNHAQTSHAFRAFFTARSSINILRSSFHRMWSGPAFGLNGGLFDVVKLNCVPGNKNDAVFQRYTQQCDNDPSATVIPSTVNGAPTLWICPRFFDLRATPSSNACPILKEDGTMFSGPATSTRETLQSNQLAKLVRAMARTVSPFQDPLDPEVTDVQASAALSPSSKLRNMENFSNYFTG